MLPSVDDCKRIGSHPGCLGTAADKVEDLSVQITRGNRRLPRDRMQHDASLSRARTWAKVDTQHVRTWEVGNGRRRNRTAVQR